jgi:hypothetical protein
LECAARGEATPADLLTVRARLTTVPDGARCSLASQHQVVVGSLLDRFEQRVTEQFEPGAPAVDVELLAPLVDINDRGTSVDISFANKKPDWTYDDIDSGKTPVERFTDHRADETDTVAPLSEGEAARSETEGSV